MSLKRPAAGGESCKQDSFLCPESRVGDHPTHCMKTPAKTPRYRVYRFKKVSATIESVKKKAACFGGFIAVRFVGKNTSGGVANDYYWRKDQWFHSFCGRGHR